MAIVDIQSHLAARNPNGVKNEIARTLAGMEVTVLMLELAADSAALNEHSGEVLIRSLYAVSQRLTAEHEKLLALL